MFVVFASALERGEVVFDGVQVWRVWRQEQESSRGAFNQLSGLGTFVEGHIIHDHDMRGFQAGTELSFQPPIEDICVAGPLKQAGGFAAGSDPGGNQ